MNINLEVFNIEEKLPKTTNNFLNPSCVLCWDKEGNYLGVATYLSQKNNMYINHSQLKGIKGFVQPGNDEDYWKIPAYWSEIPKINK